MKIIGIDSGKNGCICELDVNERICRFLSLPYRFDGMLDSWQIKRQIDFAEAHYIGLEKVAYNPVFGSRNWVFCQNFTMAWVMLETYPYEIFTPQQWQNRLHGAKGKIDAKKAKARTAAVFQRINPSAGVDDMDITKELKEAIKDAFCIGYYTGQKNEVVMGNNYTFIDAGSL